jgi:hypothetical protein
MGLKSLDPGAEAFSDEFSSQRGLSARGVLAIAA